MADASDDDARLVRPDGIAIRSLRHARGWSPRDLAAAITEAHLVATGLPVRVAPRVLNAVEERNALVSYETLRNIAAGLDTNPVELVLEDPPATVRH
jgi:transcriptional regulator with XRE-family HTH domain